MNAAALAALKQELESTQHELERLKHAVAHDLREPLGAIDGFARALVEDFESALPSEARRCIAELREGVARLGQQIDGLSSGEKPGPKPVTAGEGALRALIDALPEPAFLMDADKTCLVSNLAMAQRVGMTPSDIVRKSVSSLAPKHVAESRNARADEVMRTGVATFFVDERAGRHFALHMFPSRNPAGEVNAVACIAMEVTELKETERQLARREELLRFGFEAMRMAIWEWDPAADRLLLRAEALLEGQEQAPEPGPLSSFLSLVDATDREQVERALRDCAERRTDTCRVTFRRSSGAAPRWFEIWARLFPDGRGAERLVGTLQDVSSEVEAGQRIRASEERYRLLSDDLEKRVAERTLELASSNRELETFAYSVSHDLRGPVRSIDGFTQAVMEDHADALGSEGKRLLGIVRSEAGRMARLIDDLLKLSRVTRANVVRGPVNLSTLAQLSVKVQRTREPSRQVQVQIADGLVVEGDEGLLRIVIDNLLANAWKFSRGNSEARIEVGVTLSDGARTFFVRDNGAGFDMKYSAKLFAPFQRLHATHEFEGSGVGLATVSRIVARHGGQIWAEGEPGRGATLYFTLA